MCSCYSYINHFIIIQNKNVAHNASNILFFNCSPAREKEGKLFDLSHHPLLPHASPPKQPAEIGFKHLLTMPSSTATYHSFLHWGVTRFPSFCLIHIYFTAVYTLQENLIYLFCLDDSATGEVNSYLLLSIGTGREHQVQMPCCTRKAVTTAFPASRVGNYRS